MMFLSTRKPHTIPEHGPAYGHLANPRAIGAFVTLIVFIILSSAAVAGRFYARRLIRGQYYVYDWMVLAALVSICHPDLS